MSDKPKKKVPGGARSINRLIAHEVRYGNKLKEPMSEPRCEDCRHYDVGWCLVCASWKANTHACTGDKEATKVRRTSGDCGPAGKLFEPKQPQQARKAKE